MFGGWFGGGGVALQAEQDSTAQPGKKCCISDPLEDINLEQFTELFWKYVKERPAANPAEQGREYSGDRDTGICEEVKVETTGVMAFFADFKASFYFKYSAKGDEFYIDQYASDSTYTKLSAKVTLKFLPDSRVELLHEDFGLRKAGPVVKGTLLDDIKKCGYDDVTVESDQDSISVPGEKSAISSALDGELTTEALWSKLKEVRIDAGGEEQADGSIKLAFGGIFATTMYSQIKFDKESDDIISHDYLDDDTYQDCQFIVHTKVAQSPVRVERWSLPKAQVVSNEKFASGEGKKMIDQMIAFKE